MYNDKNWRIDPRTYIIHDNLCIKGFFEEYRWLSNMHSCDVMYDGILYPASENAYMAAKFVDDFNRIKFINLTAIQSKKYWINNYKKLDPDILTKSWNTKKYDAMKLILLDKFTRNNDLKNLLINTDNKYIEETNHWFDAWWGVDCRTGIGENNLGKILMWVRDKIQSNNLIDL